MQLHILSGRDCNLFVVFKFFIVFGDEFCAVLCLYLLLFNLYQMNFGWQI